MISSAVFIVYCERKSAHSVMKVLVFKLFVGDGGGLYTTHIIVGWFLTIREHNNSNNDNNINNSNNDNNNNNSNNDNNNNILCSQSQWCNNTCVAISTKLN